MQLARPAHALDPRRFGRAPVRRVPATARRSAFLADLKLFAMTFAAGFVFVSILIA